MIVDINFKELFPTPFGFANFGEAARELNKILVKNIDEEMEKFQPETERRTFAKNECGWQSKHGLEYHYESFKTLGDIIGSCIGPVLIQSGIKEDYANKLVVKNLWANVIFAPGGFSEPHIHGSGNILWTGVYYPHGDEKNLDSFDVDEYIFGSSQPGSGRLIIRDPAFVTKSLIKVKTHTKHRKYYGSPVSVIPRQSLLVMFPAWLEHYVQPVTDNTKRYSISFGIAKAKV
jgi:hypothetical protein